MTKRIYYDSDELTTGTQVVSCSAVGDGTYRTVLAATVFHPQGGGQPADKGTINGVPVTHVTQDGDDVVHVTAGEIVLGAARIAVQAESRNLHSRLHSAGHLLAYVLEEHGWRATKGHHWPGEARVVFEHASDVKEVFKNNIEASVNALVSSRAQRCIQVAGGTRLVGFGAVPLSACGGTHVASTDVIGHVRILNVKERKGQLSIQYDVDIGLGEM